MAISPKINREEISDLLALTPTQEGMLFHYLQDPDAGTYTVQLVLQTEGEIEKKRFQQAWNTVVAQHPALRTLFRWERVKQPVQMILKEHVPEVSFQDFSSTDDPEQAFETWLETDQTRGFDLHWPPFRVALCTTGPNEHRMVISNHHILYDGWSNGLILDSFFSAWRQEDDKAGNAGFSFKQYIRWLQNRDLAESRAYWGTYLRGVEGGCRLPEGFPDQQAAAWRSLPVRTLNPALTEKLKQVAAGEGITPAMMFYAAWGLLLQLYCDREDVLFGTTIAGRPPELSGIAKVVGLFINTPVFRFNWPASLPFRKIWQQLQEAWWDRSAHAYHSLVDIRDFAGLEGGQELFDTIVVIENYPLDEFGPEKTGNLVIRDWEGREQTHYDLSLTVELRGAIRLGFSWNAGRFGRQETIRVAEMLEQILETMLEAPDATPGQLMALPGLEQAALGDLTGQGANQNQSLQGYTDKQVELSARFSSGAGDESLAALFRNSIEKHHDAPALVYEQQRMNYRALGIRAEIIAETLVQLKIRPEELVALQLGRGPGLIESILGTLFSGGAWLPMDQAMPESRIQWMLANSGARWLIRNKDWKQEGSLKAMGWEWKADIEDVQIWQLSKLEASALVRDPDDPNRENPEQLAYMIYTSGTTGNPKGVRITKRNLEHFFVGIEDVIPMDSSDRMLSLTTHSFDIFLLESLYPLLHGALVITGNEAVQVDGDKMARVVEQEGVNILQATPTWLRIMLAQENTIRAISKLKRLMVGGEAFPPDLLSELRKHWNGPVWNLYGPTEATVFATSKTFQALEPMSIGKPFPGYRIYVTDSLGRLRPPGLPGELWISGPGVAAGYHQLDAANTQKFIPDPFVPGDRLFRTGDMGRLRPDGELECLGRMDDQVKIRGFRVELQEVEANLNQHPDVQDSLAGVLPEAGGLSLVAGVVARKSFSSSVLRSFLATRLPDYMIPSRFVLLEALPMTVSGKKDRTALAGMEALSAEKPGGEEAPEGEVEVQIAASWMAVLDLKSVGRRDKYFETGGNSLNLIRLSGVLSKQFNREITVTDLLRHPTIEAQGKFLQGSEPSAGEVAERGAALERGKQDRRKRLAKRLKNRK